MAVKPSHLILQSYWEGRLKMPCNSDYLEPTRREAELQRTAKLLVYVAEWLGQAPADWIVSEASNVYARDERLVPMLCAEIQELTLNQLDAIMYNGRKAKARDLADWWEKHQEADRQRESKEARDRERDALRQSALAKLTPAEREALQI